FLAEVVPALVDQGERLVVGRRLGHRHGPRWCGRGSVPRDDDLRRLARGARRGGRGDGRAGGPDARPTAAGRLLLGGPYAAGAVGHAHAAGGRGDAGPVAFQHRLQGARVEHVTPFLVALGGGEHADEAEVEQVVEHAAGRLLVPL